MIRVGRVRLGGTNERGVSGVSDCDLLWRQGN